MPFIPLEIYANNPSTTVSSGGTTAPAGGTSETWTVASSASFPVPETGAQQFHVADPALPAEIITVANVTGTTWTVTRGAESTAPVAHTAGFTVVQVVTAGVLTALQYPAWQFPVERYGAQGDGKQLADGTMTSGSAVLTSATGGFTAADVGKFIIVNQGAGNSTTNPLCTTISGFTNATTVTLAAAATSNAASAPFVYGTDDAAAINAAVTAAATWAQSFNQKAQVIFEPLNYMLGALTQTTNGGAGPVYNTHIPVPFATQFAEKMVLDFIGIGDASEPNYWETSVPSLSGTCLISGPFATGQPNGTFGAQSIIGGPTGATGLSPGGFANVLINITGITVVAPWNSQQIGYDFRYCAQANLPNASYLPFAPVNLSGQTVGGVWMGTSNLPTNGQSVGLYMPLWTNNDNCNVGFFTCEGCSYGVVFSEHFTAQRLALIYNVVNMWVTVPGVPVHGASILYASVEGGTTILQGGPNAGGRFPLNIGLIDTETMSGTMFVDSTNVLYGTVRYHQASGTQPTVTGAANLEIISLVNPRGPWSGAPAAPATTVAQQNTGWRNAVIYASAATSITGVSTGPASGSLTALGLAGGAGVVVPIRVMSGHWYSVTYTGALTTKWVLE